jgi:hypothetical protein
MPFAVQAQTSSISALFPSTWPASFRPWRNASVRYPYVSPDAIARNPTTGIALNVIWADSCCYEVGCDGFWLARVLIARDIRTVVFDPASFLMPRRGRLAKMDSLDAEGMTRTLRTWLSASRLDGGGQGAQVSLGRQVGDILRSPMSQASSPGRCC